MTSSFRGKGSKEKALEAKEGQDPKLAALLGAIAQVEKQFGQGIAFRLNSRERLKIDALSTGSIGLDAAIGIGGYPKGRIIEVFGQQSSGKTTLALTAIASAQRAGGNAIIIDAEHALDVKYAEKLGVDIDNLVISQPDFGEQALQVAETCISSGAFDIIVIDSVAALVPKAELDGDIGDSHMGLQARMMSQAMRKLNGAVAQNKTVLMFINQIRDKIGTYFGDPSTTTGGKALAFYASVRLDIRAIGAIKEGDQKIGHTAKVNVVKNKVSAPFKIAEFDIIYGRGIVRSREAFQHGVAASLVNKAGAWYIYKDHRYQGEERFCSFLDTPEGQPVLQELWSDLQKLTVDTPTGEVSEVDA